MHDNVLICSSLVLLLLSTIDPGPFGFVVRICWLASFVALCFVNIGGALAAYISSLAIYSPLRMAGWSTLMQRPDNFAIVILFASISFLVLKRQRGLPRFAVFGGAFLLYCFLNTKMLSPEQFPAFYRVLAVPIVACVLLTMVRFRARERNGLLIGMTVLGGYVGFVSVLEGLHAQRWIIPQWIGDSSILYFEPFFGGNEGRAGGTLMVPALNGLLLSLIFMMAFPLIRRGGKAFVFIAMVLCAAGDFFTLERGVWLGLALALFWFPGWFENERQVKMRRIALVGMLILFLVGAAAVAGGRLKDSDTILYRFAIWGAGLRLFLAHPLTGIGFYNFPTALASVQQGFGSSLLSYRTVKQEAASHNTVLTVLVEFGLVGLLLFGATIFKSVQAARRNALQLWGSPGRDWVLAFVLVYIVNAQFISAFEGTTGTAFFGLIGVIAGAQVE
jgi:O-antigen ligase